MDSETLHKEGYISRLNELDKKHYFKTLQEYYKDDEDTHDLLLVSHPRWSIITGYYAMHSISKYLIAKKLSFKISSRKTHAATLVLMEEYIKKEETKEKILGLLKEAHKIYKDINKGDWNISKYLSVAKTEREKVNYYSPEYDKKELMIKASDFSDRIVKPYLHMIKGLLKDDGDTKRVQGSE